MWLTNDGRKERTQKVAEVPKPCVRGKKAIHHARPESPSRVDACDASGQRRPLVASGESHLLLSSLRTPSARRTMPVQYFMRLNVSKSLKWDEK